MTDVEPCTQLEYRINATSWLDDCDMPTPHRVEPRLSVGFILAERFTLSAFANFVDVLRLAADEGDRSRMIRCRWRILSASGRAVRSSCGVAVEADAALSEPQQFDYIVVVGGLIDEDTRLDNAATRFLHAAASRGVPLVGVCTGAFALYRAGLMGGYRCCVSWFHRADFLNAFEGLEPVSDQIFVVDRDRITCSGGMSSAHLAASLVERHVGIVPARKSLNIMIIDEPLGAERPQPARASEPDVADPIVRRALSIARDAEPASVSVERLAARLGLGRRQLERRFRAALSTSPAKAIRSIRLAEARTLLESTDRSVTDIAADLGFSDASHLIRMFRQTEGVTPDVWRERARGTRPT